MLAIWKPNVTVAAVIERAGKFLMVEEETDDGIRFNQPAGHLDAGESLVAACARETLEESAWHFTPTALIGIYQWPRPAGVRPAAGPSARSLPSGGQGGANNRMEPCEQPSPPSMGRGTGGWQAVTYLRFAFSGELGGHAAGRALDIGIVRALWLTPAEIEASRERHRSPLVMQCIVDYRAGRRFPLDLIRHYS